jgi:hypothetical protein
MSLILSSKTGTLIRMNGQINYFCQKKLAPKNVYAIQLYLTVLAKLGDQHHLEIHDVGKGWTRYQKIVGGF